MSDSTTDKAAARERILMKIRALMAKTVDSGCTEAEANSATDAVNRLLTAYGIEMDEVSVKAGVCKARVVKGVRNEYTRFIMGGIAAFTDTKTWRLRDDSVFFGFAVDTEIAEYLAILCKHAIQGALRTFRKSDDYRGASNDRVRKEMEKGFGLGMAYRLYHRFVDMKQARDAATPTSSGTSLVVVKGQVVADAFDGLGITLNKGRRTPFRSLNLDAVRAGERAADAVPINQGVKGRQQATIRG